MANFSESLTIRILGDSSQLQRELESVTQRLADLQSRLSQLSEVNRSVDQVVGRFSQLVRPLQNVSSLLTRITNQVQMLGRTPVNLNVGPALNSLGRLSRSIDLIAAKLRALSAVPAAPAGGLPLRGPIPSIPGGGLPLRGPIPAVPSGGLPLSGPIRRFADGGFVNGPMGGDRVPATLTAGEFVIRQPAVQRLGVAFLNALNESARATGSSTRGASQDVPAASSTVVNRFGEINIQVTQSADVNTIVRDLRFQGYRLRNRRG